RPGDRQFGYDASRVGTGLVRRGTGQTREVRDGQRFGLAAAVHTNVVLDVEGVAVRGRPSGDGIVAEQGAEKIADALRVHVTGGAVLRMDDTGNRPEQAHLGAAVAHVLKNGQVVDGLKRLDRDVRGRG